MTLHLGSLCTTPMDMDRLQTNPIRMSLGDRKEWISDIYHFSFISIHVIIKDNVLTFCSPSGHFLVFTKTGPALQLLLEVQEIHFKITNVKKVTLFKDATEKFFSNMSWKEFHLLTLIKSRRKTLRKFCLVLRISSNVSLIVTFNPKAHSP